MLWHAKHSDTANHIGRQQPARGRQNIGPGKSDATIAVKSEPATAGQRRLAPVDRGRRALRAGEDAGHLGSLVENHEEDVGAIFMLDAGFRCREADAGDRAALLVPVKDPPPVQVLLPGFTVRELPVDLTKADVLLQI